MHHYASSNSTVGFEYQYTDILTYAAFIAGKIGHSKIKRI